MNSLPPYRRESVRPDDITQVMSSLVTGQHLLTLCPLCPQGDVYPELHSEADRVSHMVHRL